MASSEFMNNTPEPAPTGEPPGRRHHIWWLVIFGLVGLLCYFARSSEVFPAASIDLKLPRARILALADKWAGALGYAQAGAKKSTVFSFDDNAKTFLERELGLAQANVLMRETVPVWRWSTRLCRPLHLEEVSVSISPTGQLVSLDHALENDRPMTSIPHADARKLARDFVQEKALLSLDGFRTVEDGSVAQPHRTDHYFTWEDTRQQFNGARLRVYAYVSGNKISGFNHFLYVPENWLRKFSELRSYNKALEEIASIFYTIFSVATFFAFVWVFTSGMLRWRFSLSIAALIAVMDFLASLNDMPSTLHEYPTTMSYNGYLLDFYSDALASAFGQFLQALVLAGAAEALYRLAHPAKAALECLFQRNGLRSRQVLLGILAGHGMFGIHLGWVIAYYLLGRKIGFWSPLEVTNTESLGTIFPFYSAMYIGASAAVFEEFTYRVLGMSVFQRLVKHFWVANVLQAAAWAFMHSNYPQEPPYARGLELTAVGTLYGWVLRRYGLIACLISHYVFDAFLGVAPLTFSSIPALKATALLAILPFLVLLVIAAVLVRRQGWFRDEQLLSNSSIARVEASDQVEEIFPATPYQYKPLSARWRKILACVLVVSSLIEFGYFFPTVGKEARLLLSRDQAVARARHYLLEKNIPPFGHLEACWLGRGFNAQALQYSFEKAGFAKTAELAIRPGHPLVWQVRFFKPLDPQEYLVSLDAAGRPLSLGVSRAEDAPGARLPETQARAMVESYLDTEHRELIPIQFVDVARRTRKARTDYEFTFEVPKFKVAEAVFKVNVSAIGDAVCSFDQGWDLPQSWLFERARQTTKDQIARYLVDALGLILLLSTIWWIIGVARSGAIRWRPPIILALAVALLVIPQALNDLPEFYVGYGTDTPLLSYYVAQAVRQVLTAISAIAIAGGLAAFALAAFRLLFPRVAVASILKAGLTDSSMDGGLTKRNFWLDAVLCGYAAGIGQRALGTVGSAVHCWISPVVTLAPLESFCSLANVLNPALDSIMDALSKGLDCLLVIGILVGIYAKYCKSFRVYLALAIIISLIYPITERYWQDYLVGAVSNLAYFLGAWLLVRHLARQNLLAYFLVGASNTIAGTIRVLVSHGQTFYAQDIASLFLVLLSPFIYLVLLYSRRNPKENGSGQTESGRFQALSD